MDRKEQIKQLENDWKTNPRWKNVKRGYTRRGCGKASRFICSRMQFSKKRR